ncbi:putative Coenzyme Q-binding protein COQ10 START domain-containing protein [Seiridium cardinale]
MAFEIPPNQAPAFVAPIPTPTLGAGGSGSIVFSTTIAASPTRCLEIMLDPSTYPTWNKWVPRVTVTSASPASGPSIPSSLAHVAAKQGQLLPRSKFTLEVHMDPESASFRTTELEITMLEEFERDGRKGLRVGWKTQGNPWYLRAERVQEFLESGNGGCEYTNCETFYGPLTWAVKTFAGRQLVAGLTLWMNGLKAAAEAAPSPA